MKQEKLILDLEYQFVCEFIRIRKEKGYTQASLAELSGVLREKIAKIENHLNSPQLNSLIKILEPIGYTVKIAPIEGDTNEEIY